jgi:hypothetical protein
MFMMGDGNGMMGQVNGVTGDGKGMMAGDGKGLMGQGKGIMGSINGGTACLGKGGLDASVANGKGGMDSSTVNPLGCGKGGNAGGVFDPMNPFGSGFNASNSCSKGGCDALTVPTAGSGDGKGTNAIPDIANIAQSLPTALPGSGQLPPGLTTALPIPEVPGAPPSNFDSSNSVPIPKMKAPGPLSKVGFPASAPAHA